MYREFRELEAKIKSISEKNAGDNIGATEGTKGGEQTEGPLFDTAIAVDAAKVRAGAIVDEDDLVAIKKERDAKKREIKQWVMEFEEREGHPPTSR